MKIMKNNKKIKCKPYPLIKGNIGDSITKAFTYIELLVVVSIITIISASGVLYFIDFIDEQEISQKLSIIEDNLESLDEKVKKYSIFDYELNLSINNNSSYITYINSFDNKKQELIITNSSGSGYIKRVGTGSGELKIYKRNKLYFKSEINRNIDYPFSFNDSYYYKITGTHSGEILNDIYLDYYSENNIYPDKNDLLILNQINTKEDKSGTTITNLNIVNIGGKKEIKGDLIPINEVFLFFDNNGIEKFIKITK